MNEAEIPRITVIIVTYNSAHVIGACLQQLEGTGAAVVVVDNNSADDTELIVRDTMRNASFLQTGANLGFAKAVNLAAAGREPGSHVLLLNPDALLSGHSIEELALALQQDDLAGACAPLVRDPNGSFASIGAGHAPTIWRMFLHASGLSRASARLAFLEGHYLFPFNLGDSARKVDWVSGGCILVRGAVWDRLRGLSERWFMYAEDIELCLRIKTSGYSIVLDPAIDAIHEVGGSSSGIDGRANTLWITNLYDLYKRRIGRSLLAAVVWKIVVSAGFLARAALYRVTDLAGDGQSRENSVRFALYAKALLGTKAQVDD